MQTIPLPYYGSKAKLGRVIWSHLGKVNRYIEPFCGTASVLLARPGDLVGTEIVNDKQHLLVNCLRTAKHSPEAFAELPSQLSQVDLHLSYLHLSEGAENVANLVESGLDAHDARSGALYAYFLACDVGGPEQLAQRRSKKRLPKVINHYGVVATGYDAAVWVAIAERLSNVMITCDDWINVLGNSQFHATSVGVYLDPPYEKNATVYGGSAVGLDVAHWAAENGIRPNARIVLSEYEGSATSSFLSRVDGWTMQPTSLRNARQSENAGKEVLWLSPNCLR